MDTIIRPLKKEEYPLLEDFLYEAIFQPDETTPEFVISLYKEYRGHGIGTKLMISMLNHLKLLGYKKASLAVQKTNNAFKMYLKVGFEIISESEEEYKMICKL